MTIPAAMKKVLTVAFLVALSVSTAAQGTTQESKINASSTYVSLNAKGWAIISKQPDIVNDANKITVKILRLEQFTPNGSSERKEDLSTLNFIGRKTRNDNVSLTVNTESTVKINGAILMAQVIILKRTGKDGNAGDVVIQFELDDYAFSTDNNTLKMTLMIKGKSDSPTKISTNDDMTKYDLGGKGVLKFPKKVTLTDGYKFTIEFTKTDILEYDVLITPADVSTSSSGRGDGSTKSISLGVTMMAILILLHTVY